MLSRPEPTICGKGIHTGAVLQQTFLLRWCDHPELPLQGHLLPVHSAQSVRLVSRQVLQAQCEDSHAPHGILMV